MSLFDRASHAANVTKWKADQQMRILKAQNQIRELENQIRIQKANLADAALALFIEGKLTDNELQQICQLIDGINNQVQSIYQEIELTKQEQPPQLTNFSATIPNGSLNITPQTNSGLICPTCGQVLAGRFCPVHGLEGIPAPNTNINK